jgi:hypothetical protein
MVFRPPALGLCLWALMAERPVALPLKRGAHVHGRRVPQIGTRLPPVGRQGSHRGAAKAAAEFGHDWTQAASGLEGASPVEPGEQSPPG